ncbi:MAG TPA: T3SS effector HopA1 family protein, partial [Candidatus Saccharimonadales bacterium]|nr:T3SS effector HopA1 family protein [Candidatus Saccharimonadales bacterium]
VGQWFRDYMGGTRHRYPRHEMEFHGFNLTTTDGPKDLLHSNVKVAGIRPNIHVQGGLTSNFIQWRSSAYVEAAGRGEKPDLVKRIYLNPTMESSVKIFTEIVDAADKAGLQVKGKILDRSTSAVSSFTFKKDGSIGSLRGDGIVIGTSAKDANSLLGIVEEIYNKHRAAFAGRKVPRVPKQIGQGVAIGEDISDTESLTSHRAAVIGNAALLAKEKLGLQQWEKVSPVQEAKAIQTFRKLWSQVAAANGIDPQNIAFNRR